MLLVGPMNSSSSFSIAAAELLITCNRQLAIGLALHQILRKQMLRPQLLCRLWLLRSKFKLIHSKGALFPDNTLKETVHLNSKHWGCIIHNYMTNLVKWSPRQLRFHSWSPIFHRLYKTLYTNHLLKYLHQPYKVNSIWSVSILRLRNWDSEG